MAIRTKESYEFQNKVMENLRNTHLSPNESKYCWTLYRKTCGYGEYNAKISRIDISDFTDILEVNVSRTEQSLKSRKIIYVNGKIKGFNPDIAKWEKVSLLIPFQKVSLLIQKGIATDTKKVSLLIPPLSTKERKLQEGGVGLKKLNYKETEKLEGGKWLKQVMWQRYSFREEFIDQILNKWEFEACYDVLLAYEESNGVRDKEAWFLAKLRRGPEPEE
jgi:phage replication O-like protein O